MIQQYLKASQNEIEQSRCLRYFGVAIALSHFFSFLYWSWNKNVLLEYFTSPVRICWPIFSECYRFGIQTPWISHAIMWSYGIFSIVGAAAFFSNKYKFAYYLSIVLFFSKLLIFLQDYRLMGNYHYMLFWTHFAFLFLRNKTKTLMLLIPLFYVSAGSLKFNLEWLSSVSFLRPVQLPNKLVEWLCAFVPLLEIVLVWGLLAKNKIIFWSTLLLFACFHLFSYFVVGPFYPSIMACILSIYIFAREFEFQSSFENLDFAHISIFSKLFLVTFALIQLAPYLYAGDSALTAQGRMLSLNMLDAKSQCDDFIYLKYKGAVTIEALRFTKPTLGVRLLCDPLVLFSEARQYCRNESVRPDFIDLDMALTAKRTTDSSYKKIFEIRNFCETKPWIDILGGIHL